MGYFEYDLAVACALALLLDHWLGELPNSWHPLAWFGQAAQALEQNLNKRLKRRLLVWRGALAWSLAVGLPVLLLAPFVLWSGFWGACAVLYFTLGLRSLGQHAQAIAEPLKAGNINGARSALSMIVSRDTRNLDAQQISTASVESSLENGADAVLSALFWFVVAGPLGAVAYRLINTLDAMWGYRSERFEAFGKVAARADDVANWLPARLTALSYCLLGGQWRAAFKTLRHQRWYSPNAGLVMGCGAASLELRLGGDAIYDGVHKSRPVLGAGRPASAADILRAIALVQRSAILWCLLLLGASFGQNF